MTNRHELHTYKETAHHLVDIGLAPKPLSDTTVMSIERTALRKIARDPQLASIARRLGYSPRADNVTVRQHDPFTPHQTGEAPCSKE